MPIRLEVIS